MPVHLYAPRKVPLSDSVKKELEQMVAQDVISPIAEPTEWCSGMVIVPKPNRKIWIYVDLMHQNKNMKHEIYLMATVEDSLANLRNGHVF